MSKASTRYLSLWSVVAFGLVVTGAMMSRGVVAQDQPIYVSGADVAPAYEKGNWKDTAERMQATYEEYKAAGWDSTQVPWSHWQHADQKWAENEDARSSQVSGFVVPQDPVYSEVAFWCDTYYRQNVNVFKNKTVCHPQGFFLVMYKDGVLEKVNAKDVRLIPHPTIPDGMIQAFPRMRQYNPDLPPLPAFDNME